ncbi:MAG: hypothetical protein C0622_06440 [Desulfuromonas sp.]|nr:MAG: hypothetical protein C0622_06440 [Desulfuromonas sp.]
MIGAFEILLVILLYSGIWLVPVTINNRRRKHGLPPYWSYFSVSIVLEISLVYAILYCSKLLKIDAWGLYLAPVIAAMGAGWFYVFMAQRADKKIT